MQPGRGGQICRSAGTSATLTAREGKWAQITLPSGEVRRVSSECRATIGMIGNAEHMNISLGKAGRKRWHGPQAAQPRHVDEPGQPSDGRRRRPNRGRPASVQSDGRAGQGRQDAQEAEAIELGDHPPPSSGTASSTIDPSRMLGDWDRTGTRQVLHGFYNHSFTLLRGERDESVVEKRAVRRRAAAREGREKPAHGQSRADQDVVARLHHRSRVRRRQTFLIHNGRQFMKLYVTEDMVGHKLGEFSPTRIFKGHSGGKAKRSSK